MHFCRLSSWQHCKRGDSYEDTPRQRGALRATYLFLKRNLDVVLQDMSGDKVFIQYVHFTCHFKTFASSFKLKSKVVKFSLILLLCELMVIKQYRIIMYRSTTCVCSHDN